ncbi:hypothetical protein [Winogradskyella sp.]|uniref:hypothetical protein n=1 Tax=Winogradskyella sp. TaxID=1883156 RepID=UPI001B1D1E1E|nr:hypothetical protein [Winogradskyella sp.]MBO6881448.1 hypothetical protein [Winogradskyella sp.]
MDSELKKEDGFIEMHSMGKDCIQLIDKANEKNAIFIRFLHNDSEDIKAQKINDGKEKLIADRIKSNLKKTRKN